MDKRSVRFAKATSPSLLIFDVPDLIAAGGESVATFALPLISRQGGLLVALPVGVLEDEAFAQSPADEDQMVGPMKVFEGIELYEEDDTGSGAIQVTQCGLSCSVVICDFLDSFAVHEGI